MTSRKAISGLSAAMLIDWVAFGATLPGLPAYAGSLGASNSVVALCFSLYALGALISGPFLGQVSDRYGRKKTLVVTVAVTLFGLILTSMAHTPWQLLAARAVVGIAATKSSIALAFVADVTPVDERARGLGLVSSAMALGFVAGPVLGGWLVGEYPIMADLRRPFQAAVLVECLALISCVVLLREPQSHERSREQMRLREVAGSLLKRRPIFVSIISLGLVAFTAGGSVALFPVWSNLRLSWGVRENGLAFTVIGLVVAISQSLGVPYLSRVLGITWVAALSAAALLAGFLTMAECSTAVGAIPGILLFSVGFGMSGPSLTTIASRCTAASQQGALMGITESIKRVGELMGPAILVQIFDRWGDHWFYHVQAIAVGLALILIYCGKHRALKLRS